MQPETITIVQRFPGVKDKPEYSVNLSSIPTAIVSFFSGVLLGLFVT